MVNRRELNSVIDDCVRYCGRRNKWFLYVVGYVHRLVRRHAISEFEAGEITFQARHAIKAQRRPLGRG